MTSLITTFFLKDNYRFVENINPVLLSEPKQTAASDKTINFTKDDYNYELTPVANYEINALVVHKMDYRIFSIYKTDSVFPVDLCLLWGENVKNKVYQNKNLKYSQDSRFCFFRWSGNVKFNSDEISNNHLVVADENILHQIDKIRPGDQVKISGKLVNVDAKKVNPQDKNEPQEIKWQTSTTRTDAGAGACEIIYVEKVDILTPANQLARFAFTVSLWGLAIVALWSILVLFWPVKRLQN